MAHDIFLSYSRQDSETMRRVQQALTDAGLTIWTDQGILPGSPSWKTAIEQAIRDTASVVVLFSPDANTSRWVRSELDYAEAQRKPIYPLLVEGDAQNAVPFGFTTSQWIDLRDPARFDQNVARLIEALRTGAALPPVNAQPIRAASGQAKGNSRRLLPAVMGVIALIAIIVIGATALNNQQPSPTISPTETQRTFGAGTGNRVIATLAPEAVPEGWQVVRQDNIEVAVPANWLTFMDVQFLYETFGNMFAEMPIDYTVLFNPETTVFVSSDVIEVRGLAIMKDAVGIPLSLDLLDLRIRGLFEQSGISAIANISETEVVELPVGTALRYHIFVESNLAETSTITYAIQHGLNSYLLNVAYRTIDEGEFEATAEQIAQTWRITE